jgi:hypothetical protein
MTLAAACCRSLTDGFGTHRRLQAVAVGSRPLAPINLARELVERSREEVVESQAARPCAVVEESEVQLVLAGRKRLEPPSHLRRSRSTMFWFTPPSGVLGRLDEQGTEQRLAGGSESLL